MAYNQNAVNAFTSRLARGEGKKSQVGIGNIRELVAEANRVLSEKLGENFLYKAISQWEADGGANTDLPDEDMR